MVAGLGLVLPTFPQDRSAPDAAELTALCRRAQAAGATSLWACDHLYWPGPTLECFTALAVAAATTTDTRIGTCVLQLPLRGTSTVAKQVSSLQELSGGRFVLGVGVGTHPGEYEAAGVKFDERGRLLDQQLDELAGIWSGTLERGEVVRYAQRPEPAPIPVWVGGSSPAARRRAARQQGWMPLFVEPDEYRSGLAAIRADATAIGGDPSHVTGATVAFVSVGRAEPGLEWMSSLYGLPERAFARHLISGPAPEVSRRLWHWVEAGAEEVVVFVTADDPGAQFEDLAGEFRALQASVGDGAPVPPPAAGAR